MPIDPTIASGVRPVQLESPVNQMANIYALQNAQQSNQLNQLKMDEYKRGIANTERRNALLGGFTPDMNVADQVNALARGGYLDDARLLAESESKINKDKRESELAASTLKANNIKFHRDLLTGVRDQSSYENWGKNAIKDVPELGQMLPAQYTPELISQLAMSADKFIESQKPREVGPGTVVLGPNNRPIFTAPFKPEPSSDIPKLKPGEVWDATAQTVKQVPGSAEYNKQSKVHGTDYNATKTVISKMDNAIAKVNEILSPENKSGFEGNFGGYNAALTRQFTGNTAKVKKNIETVKADMKSAGLELVRSGGSIGALTEREWPMLEAQIDAIDYMLDEKDAEAAFKRVISTFNRIKDQAKDTYQTTWGETQYFKPDVIKSAGKAPAAPAAKTKDQLDYEAFINAQSGAKRR